MLVASEKKLERGFCSFEMLNGLSWAALAVFMKPFPRKTYRLVAKDGKSAQYGARRAYRACFHRLRPPIGCIVQSDRVAVLPKMLAALSWLSATADVQFFDAEAPRPEPTLDMHVERLLQGHSSEQTHGGVIFRELQASPAPDGPLCLNSCIYPAVRSQTRTHIFSKRPPQYNTAS